MTPDLLSGMVCGFGLGVLYMGVLAILIEKGYL